MLILSRCPCGHIANIFTEKSFYNNYSSMPWNAYCRCSNCKLEVGTILEYDTEVNAVKDVADRWNNHPAVKRANILNSAVEDLRQAIVDFQDCGFPEILEQALNRTEGVV
jgi:hypothetical protein